MTGKEQNTDFQSDDSGRSGDGPGMGQVTARALVSAADANQVLMRAVNGELKAPSTTS